MPDKTEAKTAPFRLEEATIDDLHMAIRSGATTVAKVVEAYLARVHAMARQLTQERDRIRKDAGLGVVAPDFIRANAKPRTLAI